MYSEVLKYLKCPNCGEELKIIWTSKTKKDEIIEGTIGCINDHRWTISEGVLNLSTKKQKNFNAWSEYYKKVDYEELNQQIMSKTPDNLKDLYESTKAYISSYINKIKPNCILDICSGYKSKLYCL
jgi:transcription initiation factor IIE alpha subunit